MMTLNRYARKLAKLSTVCLLTVAATASIAQAKPTTQRTAPAGNAIYDRAKKQMPEDVYTLYRIVERIARANGLDERPWRVGIVASYDINAFATQVNLVAFNDGLLDQLNGDSSAIACIVGHEMAHHSKRHIALGKAQREEIAAKARKEAEEEVNREISNAKRDSTITGIAGGILGGLGGSILRNESRNRISRAEQRIQEIAKRKQAEMEEKMSESVRKQEFEADELGYLYAARAGFEAQGCLRAMEVLARTPGAEFDTTHPAVPKRIESLQQLMRKQTPTALAAEGKAKLAKTQPLTYDLSKDGQTLRINSRFGSGSSSDVDRVLGK